MNAQRDHVARVAVIIVLTAFIVGVVVLILDLIFEDLLDDDVSATLAGFIAGLVGVMAVGVARWLDNRDEND